MDVAVAQSAAPFMQDLIKAVAAGLPPGHPRAPSLSLPPAAHVYALPGDVAIMLASCILHRCGELVPHTSYTHQGSTMGLHFFRVPPSRPR